MADDPRFGRAGTLATRVEALLFVAPGPVSTAHLAQALQVSVEDIDQALILLGSELADRGIRLQRHAGKVQFTTAPERAQDVETFLQLDAAARLSRAALEVLAIIAYRQPVTKPYVDSLRGVDSESSLTTLLRHGLIEESGRTEGPGRPILYSSTPDFLRHFGLQDLDQLPQLPADEPAAPVEAGGGPGETPVA